MKSAFRVVAPAFALALGACSTTSLGSEDSLYLEQAPARQTYASPLAAAEALVGGHPESMEGRPTLDLRFAPLASDPSRLEMIVMVEPLLDDSVAAQEWRAVLLQGEDRQWRVTELGLRQKCYRSRNPDEWVARLCP
ncbi:hypothetical protein [Aurantiacibacter marinus]|uniref:Lipoprotein n=1 Tax=Aurantiacibacter marinus TaxID=874156 RepID=A0A0H0XRS3_9SPHN|nr:hypothetical protein [Aurantiacibacter marinus]KLI64706.1 hypothetical protein AAV99_04000 [Aurantiacibacter marinus]